MTFLALQYTYTCTEPDAHTLIQKLINLVSELNRHLIVTCFRFNYFCPNIVKIYFFCCYFWFPTNLYHFLGCCFFKRIAVNALFKVVLYIVERFDSLDYGRLYYSQHYTPRDYRIQSYPLCYCCTAFVIIVRSTNQVLIMCMYRAGFLFVLTVKGLNPVAIQSVCRIVLLYLLHSHTHSFEACYIC